ncbi:stalk domain-containing protein [Paenibacillus sp. WLX2291]|uniref:stalk domain-containing protein n=1 Tax=Paenibacillus sp. WLX2291 TaxID=3296934 RepID=UPI0039841518
MKTIKMLWIISVLMIIGLVPTLTAQAATELTIVTPAGQKLDGGTLTTSRGQLMLPLRQLAQATHSQFHIAANGTITLAPWAGEVYTFKLGQNEYKLNDGKQNVFQLYTPIQKMNGRMYIPAAVIRQLGYNYTYNKQTLTIQLPLNRDDRQILDKGDLASARKLIVEGTLVSLPGVHSLRQPLEVTSNGEMLDREFLFPEGEALRFYYIYGDTISLIEFKGDFLVITWQAHGLSAETGDFHTLNDLLTFQLKDKWSDIPLKYQNFVYYLHGGWGDSSLVETGIIHSNNSFHRTGRVYKVGGAISDQSGTISYTLPDEKRIDTR